MLGTVADAAERDPDRVRLAAEWYVEARQAFLSEYLATADRHPRLMPDELHRPVAALELEKAAYEVLYELNNRPDWLPIPTAAFSSAS